MAKNLRIRGRYGAHSSFSRKVSAAQVRQVLEQITPDLQESFGDYVWELKGNTTDGYKIVATYQHGRGGQQSFVESTGSTPIAALRAFTPARNLLLDVYGVSI